jgi:hypothetical protein
MGLPRNVIRILVGLAAAGFIVFLGSCLNPTSGEFSMEDSGEGLPDPDEVLDIYSTSGNGTDSWEVAHNDLPRGDFDYGGIASTDQAVYVAVDSVPEGKPGIYRLASGTNSWELHLDGSDFNYRSISNLQYHPDNDHLYFEGHSAIYRVDTGSGGTYTKDDQSKGGPLELVISQGDTPGFDEDDRLKGYAVIPDHDGHSTLVVQKSGTSDPEFYTLDVTAAINADGNADTALTSTGFRNYDAALDGKPHVQLFADQSGRIYFVTNYSGIYRYDDSWNRILEFPNEHTDKNSAPVGAGLAADGTLYVSYERRPATQIATFFQYNEGSDSWTQVYETQGYGPDMVGMTAPGTGSTSDGAVMAMTGRFGNTIINAADQKAYRMPSTLAGLNLTSDDRKSTSARGAAVLGDTVYYVQSVQKAGHDAKRVLRLTADRSKMPFYTWNLATEGTGNLGVSGDAIAVETAILSGGTVLAAYNKGDPATGTLATVGPSVSTVSQEPPLSSGEAILDLSAHPDGSGFALATTTGVYWYSSVDSREELVSYDSDKKRVDVGREGTVVALLDNSTVGAWSASGSPVDISDGDSGDYLSVGRSYVEDVAVSDKEDDFYVVGFDNKNLPSGAPVQVAYLESRALSDGSLNWQRFGFDGDELSNNVADTRLYHVEVSSGGDVVVGGESAGPQSIFRFDGTSYSGETDHVVLDTYNAPWLSGGAPHLSYMGRFRAGSGEYRNGQTTMTILSSGDYNTLRADALTVDTDGRMYLGGTAAARMANRGALEFDGTPVASYQGGDPSLLVSSRDQTVRHTWMSFNTGNRTGSVTGLAARSVDGKDYAAALTDVGRYEDSSGGIHLVVFRAESNFEH